MKVVDDSRRYSQLQAIVMLVAFGSAGAFAGSFQNLNFESARIQSAPANYVPWDAYQPIDAAAALPFWTVREDNLVATAVWGDAVALDETSVALVTPSASDDSPIQGKYSVQLYAYADAPPGYFHTVSISQVGIVPLGTQSIEFLLRSPPVAGGVIEAVPTVTLNGMPIDVFAQSSSGGVFTMVGDVSAFAGSTADLTIQSVGTSGEPGTLSENIFDLDAISFSPSSAPEPPSCEVLFFGLGWWLFYGLWRKRNRKQCEATS
jgi:hypothetical protein